MRALVISGGGSKGAFAGGVAQYLIDERGYKYDILVGTSTGSLMISHLALDKVDKIKKIYTSVNQNSIFNSCPFIVKVNKEGEKKISINHLKVMKSFLRGRKTFGESKNLRKMIFETFTVEEFEEIKASKKDVVVTVSNLSLNQVEYKSIKDFEYEEFCDWIWISCNFIPFMSLAIKNGCEYADGGFASMVPIEEAISRGATIVDVIVLETEVSYYNRTHSKNVFELMTSLHSFMANRIERQNIRIGKFAASYKDAILHLYYTPTVLTTNSLIFDEKMMTEWWESGYQFAKQQGMGISEVKAKTDK